MESRVRYAERLRMPWTSWLAVAALAVVSAGLVHLGNNDWWRIAAGAAAFVLPLVAAWWFGRLPVRVTERDGQLWLDVDDATLPMSAVASVEALDRTAFSDALGVAQHPLAFVVQRPWVKGGIRVVLDDPQDPTPYWVISSRNPERLREALSTVGAEQA